MTHNKILGNKGEALAKKYLINHGYTILASNYRSQHLEIDLIAFRQPYTVFVEVKTRIKTADANLENPLAKWQTKNLKRAIIAYCYAHHLNLELARLDLIVISVNNLQKKATLKHYRDIF